MRCINKMALRNTLLSVGLLGLVSTQEVQAQDRGKPYAKMTHGETLRVLVEKSEKVTYSTFDKEIKQFPGAVIMQATSTCPSAEKELLHRNQEIVYLQLLDKFAGARVNDLPLKFMWFDICGRSGWNLLGITGLETHMYLNGREIDRMVGGPTSLDWAREWYTFLSSEWIPTNLTHPNEEYVWRFQGTHDEKKIALRP